MVNDMLRQTSNEVSSSSEAIWKEITDPITAKKVYIHSKTGKSFASRPGPNKAAVTCADSVETISQTSTSVGLDEGTSSTSYGSRPISAAPHLSHNFQRYFPGSKRLRLDSNAVATSGGALLEDASRLDSNAAASSGQPLSCAVLEDAAYRDKDVNKENDEMVSCGDSSFEKLLKNWTNPSFLPGQEVECFCIIILAEKCIHAF